jgi:hypothetical protein
MTDEANAKEAILSSVRSIDFSKSFLLSRTFWVNVIALLSLLFPAVRDWAAAEPEAPVIILAFFNLVLRTVTSRPVKLLQGGSEETDSAGGLGLVCIVGCTAAGALGCLPSCTHSQLEALRGVPLKIGVETDDSRLTYSSKGGLLLEARVIREK